MAPSKTVFLYTNQWCSGFVLVFSGVTLANDGFLGSIHVIQVSVDDDGAWLQALFKTSDLLVY